jgi:transportin-3
LTDFIEQLYEFYLKVFESSIDIASFYEITEGIAYVINTQEDSKIQQIITMFIKPVVEKLSSYTLLPQTEELNVKIADEIEIIRIFFEFIRPRNINDFSKPDPTGALIIEIYPVVEQLVKKFGYKSIKVSERCSKYLKTILQQFNLYLESILPSIANILVEGFEQTRFGCYLWVSGTVIKEFGDEEYGVSPQLKNSIWEFSKQQIIGFLKLISSEVNQDTSKLIEIPDLVEDFFRMMNDILMFYFKEFLLLNDDLLNSVFEVAVFSLNINKFDPLISDLHFLIDLVSWGFETPPISIYYDDGSQKTPDEIKFKIAALINNNGQVLIDQLLQGLIFKFPLDAHPDAYDLLIKTLKLATNIDQVISWLDFALNNLSSVSNQEREKLLTTVKHSLGSKDYRRIRSSLKDFISWYSRKNISPRLQT